MIAFLSLLLRAAASRAESLRSRLPRRTPSPQHAIDETNQTQAGGGVVSQKVAKFTADDFTA